MSDNGSTSYQVYASAPGTPVSGSSCPTLNAADPATLSATYPCDLTVLGINFAPGCRLSATATESVQ
jgi:hypothetical protein